MVWHPYVSLVGLGYANMQMPELFVQLSSSSLQGLVIFSKMENTWLAC